MPIQENIQNFSLDTNTNSITADQSSMTPNIVHTQIAMVQNPNVTNGNYLQETGQQEVLTVQNPNVANSNYLQETEQQEDLTVQSPIQETEQNINQPNFFFQSETGQQILQPQQFQEQHQQHIPITTLPIDGSVDLIKQALCLSDIDLENESKYSNPSPAPPLVEVGLSINSNEQISSQQNVFVPVMETAETVQSHNAPSVFSYLTFNHFLSLFRFDFIESFQVRGSNQVFHIPGQPSTNIQQNFSESDIVSCNMTQGSQPQMLPSVVPTSVNLQSTNLAQIQSAQSTVPCPIMSSENILSTPAGMLPTPDVPAVSTKIKGQTVAQPAESCTGQLLIPVPDFDNIPSGSGRQRRSVTESDNTENEEVNLKKFGKCKAFKGKPYLKTGKPDKEADVYQIANELGIIIPVEDNKKKNDENFEKGFDDDNLNGDRGKSVTCEAIESSDLVKNDITTGDLTPVMVSPGNPRPTPTAKDIQTKRKDTREIVKKPANWFTVTDETKIKVQAKIRNNKTNKHQSPAAKKRNIPNLRTMLRDKPSQAPVTITRPVIQVPPNIPDFEKLGFKFEELF